MPPIRTTVAILSCTALLGGLAVPAFAQDTTGTYPTDSADPSQTQKPKHKKGKRHGGRLTDAQLTKVATKLGTTLEALKAARAEVKAAVRATEAHETRAQEDALLASKLDVTVEKLRAAFASVAPARGEHRGGRGGCEKPPSSTSTDDTSGTYPSGSAGTYPAAV